MDWFNAILRTLIGGYASLFGSAHPLVSLVPLSVLVGIGMLWVFGRTSDQQKILRTKKRLQAHLLELRLFGDDPRLIWQAQKNLILSNFRYIGLMLKPAVILTVPMVVLLFHLDAFYGRRPLPVGSAALLTVQVDGRLANNVPVPKLKAPPGLTVETPAVRALDQGQFSWRVRASGPIDGKLGFEWNDTSWTKSVLARDELGYISSRRVASWLDSVVDPGEDLLAAGAVSWVEIEYPTYEIGIGGFEIHWLIWFFVISMVSAYALKGLFGVTI